MGGQRARVPAPRRHQKDLASAKEDDLFAVGRPARRGFAAVSEGELNGSPRGEVLAPQMGHAAVRFPVDLGQLVRHGVAIRSELWIQDVRHLPKIDEAHGSRALRLSCR